MTSAVVPPLSGILRGRHHVQVQTASSILLIQRLSRTQRKLVPRRLVDVRLRDMALSVSTLLRSIDTFSSKDPIRSLDCIYKDSGTGIHRL